MRSRVSGLEDAAHVMAGNPIRIGYGARTCVRSSRMSLLLTNLDYTVPALASRSSARGERAGWRVAAGRVGGTPSL